MSEYATTERLGRLKAWICEMSAACAQLYPDNVKWEQRWYDLQAATDAFAKSISTPIPLTPSDEMVAAASEAIYDALEQSDIHDLSLCNGRIYLEGNFSPEAVARACLTAALNLMGGK